MAVRNPIDLFGALLNDDTPVSLQRRILNHAVTTKDVELMVRLSRIASLDAEIDAALSRRPEADVLLAWASRPGRTSEALVERFSKEKRATLLAELAARPDLSEALYLELARSESASVAVALTTNPAAPLEARKAAAARAIRTVRDSYSSLSRVAELFAGLPAEVAENAIDGAVSPLQLAGLCRFVSDEKQPTIAAKMASLLFDYDANWHCRNALHTVWEHLTVDQRVEYQEALQKVIDSPDALPSAKQHAKDIVNRSAVDPVSAAVKLLLTESDPAAIRTHMATASAAGYGQRRAAVANALQNPNCPYDVLAKDLKWAGYEELVFLTSRSDFGLDAAVTLLVEGGSAEAFDQFATVLDAAALARAVAAGDRAPGWLANTRLVRTEPIFLLGVFPANDVIAHPLSGVHAREVIMTRLGEDDERWLTFQRLLPEWAGTLPSLLDAVEQLS